MSNFLKATAVRDSVLQALALMTNIAPTVWRNAGGSFTRVARHEPVPRRSSHRPEPDVGHSVVQPAGPEPGAGRYRPRHREEGRRVGHRSSHVRPSGGV